MKKSFLYILLLLLNFPPVFIKAYDIVSIQTKSQLSTNSITAIAQDSFGFLWIGSDFGIGRYDGYSIHNAPFLFLNDSIGFSKIECLFKDSDGNLWIGTQNGGYLYKNKIEKVKCLLSKSFIVTAIIEDRNKKIWIGTNNGLYIFDKDGNIQRSIKQKNGLTSNSISSIKVDIDNNIWVGTTKGIDIISFGGSITNNKLQIKNIKKNIRITCITIDNYDCIWYSSNNKIYFGNRREFIYNQESSKLIADNTDVLTVYVTNEEVWFGTRGNGILRFTRNQINNSLVKDVYWVDKNNPNELKNSIVALFEDNFSNIWFGTKDGLFMLLRKNYTPFTRIKSNKNLSNTPSNNTISGIVCDNSNRIWMSTGNGINSFERINQEQDQYKFIHYFDKTDLRNIMDNNKFQSIIEINKGVFLTSTKSNVKLFDSKSGNFYVDPQMDFILKKNEMRFVRSFFKDNDGKIWMAFAKGNIAIYDPILKKTTPFIINNHDSWSIVKDKFGVLWVASGNDGLFKIKLNSKGDEPLSIVNYPRTFFYNKWVTTLSFDNNGFLWIGTSAGLYLYSYKNNILKKFSLASDNDEIYISGIIEDLHHNVWVASINGIYKIANFNTVEYYGFKGDDIARFLYVFGHSLSKDGFIFFGGVNGLIYFDPTKVYSDEHDNMPYYSSFKILNREICSDGKHFNKNINVATDIVLEHSDYQFSFEISNLYFPDPDLIGYGYKLEGFDKDWNYTNSNLQQFSYSNVPPGNYILKVKATNATGIWSNTIHEIRITILPPWWRSWWSYSALIIIVFFAIYFIFRFISFNYKFKHQEELTQWKLHYYTNISHSFKTPLTLIYAPLQNILDNLDNLQGEELKTMLLTMQRNVKKLMFLVTQLLEFRKIDLGKAKLNLVKSDIVHFVREVTETFQLAARSKNIKLSFDPGITSIEVIFDAEKIEIILFNLLTNALRHTEINGEIVVRCYLEPQKYRLWISVLDNGIGIHPDYQKKIFERFFQIENEGNKNVIKGAGIGLSLSKDFIKMHHGEIFVQSELNKGSLFKFYLPLSDSAFIIENIKEEKKIFPMFSDKNEIITNVLQLSDPNIAKSSLPVIYCFDPDLELLQFVKYTMDIHFQIETFSDEKKIYQRISERTPSLIIADTFSTLKNEGFELCKRLKTNSMFGHIPILLVTSDLSEQIESLAFASGADAFLTKPFDISYLMIRINQLLRSHENLKEKIKQELIVNPKDITISTAEEVFLATVMNVLMENIENENLDIDLLASKLNMSRSMLYRRISQFTQQSPVEFVKTVRLKRAKQLLETGIYNVSEVGDMIGFRDSRYFGICFKKLYEISPKAYAKKYIKKNGIME